MLPEVKNDKNASAKDKLNEGFGDRWIHLAIDAISHLIMVWNMDRRTQKATYVLVSTVAARLENPRDVLYASDQHSPYKVAIEGLNTTEEARCQEPTTRAPRLVRRRTGQGWCMPQSRRPNGRDVRELSRGEKAFARRNPVTAVRGKAAARHHAMNMAAVRQRSIARIVRNCDTDIDAPRISR